MYLSVIVNYSNLQQCTHNNLEVFASSSLILVDIKKIACILSQ
jgi:hypothetical protein